MKSFIAVIACFTLLAASSAFAGTKISAMPAASTVNAADTVPIVQGGVNKSAAASLFTNALTATDVLNKVKSVAGSGSGLDADQLDGLHSTSFATAAQGVKADNAQPAATAVNTGNVNSYVAVMTGAVNSFAQPVCPTGWVKANGQAISRSTNSALFAVVSTMYGTGDGSTTFNVPDLRGVFARGWADDNGIYDVGRAMNSTKQASSNLSHAHGVTDPGHNHGGGATTMSGGYVAGPNAIITTNTAAATTGITVNPDGTTESRPVNLALLYCIKL